MCHVGNNLHVCSAISDQKLGMRLTMQLGAVISNCRYILLCVRTILAHSQARTRLVLF